MHSIETILRIAEAHDVDITYAHEYAEPGYDCDKGIAFANWNDKTRYDPETRKHVTIDDAPSRLLEILTRMGFECEWSDEWSTCDECGRAVRTSPDCHSWLPGYKILNECELVCKGCCIADVDAYADSLIGNPDSADTLDVNWPDLGFVRLDTTYETGFHPGQNDDPHKVSEWLESLGVERYLFEITGKGQFDTEWCVWIDAEELEKVK